MKNKFAEVAMFATAAIEDPQASQEDKIMIELQGLKSAYVAALTALPTLPKIGEVFTPMYKGNVGDMIFITSKAPYILTQ